MIPRETVDRILDAAQIAEVVGDFVDLKRRGANYVACCPFHNEKTPSFYVSPAKGIYKCFGCGKAGSAVDFVKEHESMTFPEALRYLARKYHIEVVEEEETAEDLARKQHKDSLYIVSKFAAEFFQKSLKTPMGQAIAYQYFHGKRKLDDLTIEKYGLGWAPQSRDELSRAAREAGYKEDYLVETGLSIRRDDGSLTDRFFDRVMFPIHSVTGQIIAFGGRTLKTDKSVAKYVNSPETEIYVKNKSLYGIYFAKNEISRQRKCILVEGYLDVLSMHQLGILNVVASSGTSLTTGQVELIRRFADDVTIIYDGDSAGIHAALRGIGLVLKGGLNVRVVLLPDGEDPDSFACSHTLAEVRDYISAHERDFIGFMTDMLLGEAGSDPLKRAALVNEVADTVALIPDQIVRAMYIQTCSAKFGMEEQILYDRVKHTREAMLIAEKKQRERAAERAALGSESGDGSGVLAGAGTVPDNGIPQAGSSGIQIPGGQIPGNQISGEHISGVQISGDQISGDQIPGEHTSGGQLSGARASGVHASGGASGRAAGADMDAGSSVRRREEEPVTASGERELLCFLLEYGDTDLKFEPDSPWYDKEDVTPTVADFILNTLEGNGIRFRNSVYAGLLEKYAGFYDGGLQQSQILSRLRDSEDPETSAATRDLLVDKYNITVRNFESSLTSTDTLLTTYIPKSLMQLQLLNVELELKALQRELLSAQDADAQEGIIREISERNRLKAALSRRLQKQ